MSTIKPYFTAPFEHLKNQFSNNTLAHALLLAAPKGVGKLNFARILAETFLGEFKNGFHSDYFELMPEEDKKNISVDQVRSLITKLSQTANQNGYKVAVIYPAETMNIAASNALLKTLEEPLGKTILILCTHQQSRLLPTIISRCQRIPVKIPSSTFTYNNDFYKEGFEKLNEIIDKKINPIKLAEAWAKEDVEEIVNMFQLFVCKKITIYYPSPSLRSTSPARGEVILTHRQVEGDNITSPLAGEVAPKERERGIQKFFSLLDKITEAKRTLQSQSNPNKQLLLENLLLELSWN